MRFLQAMIFGLLLASVTLTKAELDKCPAKQHELQAQASTARAAWEKINTNITNYQFSRTAFQAQYRTKLEELAVHDLEDTLTAWNATAPPGKKIPSISRANLQIAAKKKVELSLARPEVQRAMEDATQQAQDSVIKAKADALQRLAGKKQEMDNEISAAGKQLDASCTYDFPSQMVRIVDSTLDLKSSVENGVLNIMLRNTPFKVKDGQIWNGDHPLMDIPVVATDGVKVGGVNIAPLPTFNGGNVQLPILPGVAPVNIRLPDVSVGHGPGLGVKIGNWSF